ncbi:MAG: signal peptidase I [Proteobacteria bacterium]|nr:signal peptidase I [Pseudomonadota bacterium]
MVETSSDALNQNTPNKSEETKKKAQDSDIFSLENFKSLCIMLLVVFVIRSCVVAPYEVPTPSMEPTIKVGDRIVANKLAYSLRLPFVGIELIRWGKIKRGNIIVFGYPANPNIDYVKRVVGVGGDSIQIIGDILYINSKPVPRVSHEHDRSILSDVKDQKKDLYVESIGDYNFFVTHNSKGPQSLSPQNWPAEGGNYHIPEDGVFVMGDNRDNSHDSRRWLYVPLSYVKGKAEMVLWSSKSSASYFPNLRWQRFFSTLYQDINLNVYPETKDQNEEAES